MPSKIKSFIPMFVAALLALTSLSCMAVTQLIFEPTLTPVPTPTPTIFIPTLTPEPTSTSTPSPTATQDACPNGDCITACIDQLHAIAQPGITPNGGIKPAYRDFTEDNRYMLVSYDVHGNLITNPTKTDTIPGNLVIYQNDTLSQQKIWDYFSAIIPQNQRTFLEEYDVFSDGKDNALAFVSPSKKDFGRWKISIDIVDASNPQDLTYTLIHEFGHLLTLNPSQVTPSKAIFDNPKSVRIYQQEADACKTFFADEGCSHADSYVNLFFNRFWPEIYGEWSRISDLQDDVRFRRAIERFYLKYKDQFVTDYAPTSPLEDIAESFAQFITASRPNGDSIAVKKVAFFYDFPELVQLRSQIGRQLCDQIKK